MENFRFSLDCCNLGINIPYISGLLQHATGLRDYSRTKPEREQNSLLNHLFPNLQQGFDEPDSQKHGV